MNKKFIFIITVVISVLILIGCNAPATNGTEDSEQATNTPDGIFVTNTPDGLFITNTPDGYEATEESSPEPAEATVDTESSDTTTSEAPIDQICGNPAIETSITFDANIYDYPNETQVGFLPTGTIIYVYGQMLNAPDLIYVYAENEVLRIYAWLNRSRTGLMETGDELCDIMTRPESQVQVLSTIVAKAEYGTSLFTLPELIDANYSEVIPEHTNVTVLCRNDSPSYMSSLKVTYVIDEVEKNGWVSFDQLNFTGEVLFLEQGVEYIPVCTTE